MYSIAIAIIVFEDQYLFLKKKIDKNTEYSLWNHEFKGHIGLNFDYTSFRENLERFLGIDLKDSHFTFIREAGWENENKPHTSLYKLELTKEEKEVVSEKIKEDHEWLPLDKINLVLEKPVKKHWNSTQIEVIQSFNFLVKKPDLTPSFISDIELIHRANSQNKLVIFAGAGVSLDSGVPSWGTLVNMLHNELGEEKLEPDYMISPQLFFHSRDKKEYNEKIREILKYNKVKPNPIHDKILDLEPLHIITTNFDDLLEQAQQAKNKTYQIIKRDSHLPYSQSHQLLVKMHGDLEELNMVLKEDDYLDYSKNFPLTEALVRFVFASKLVLFVGFSFSDPNLKQILKRVRNVLREDFQPAYLFTLEKPSFIQREYFKKKGIRIIPYDPNIEHYLTLTNQITFPRSLSQKGQQTFNFLNLISVYDPLAFSPFSPHIIQQLYNSISRFDSLPSIPPQKLKDFYPFNVNPTSYKADISLSEFSEFHLSTKNEELIRLLGKLKNSQNKIIIQNNEIKSIDQNWKENSPQKPKNWEPMLVKVFQKLSNSAAMCIQRKDDRSEKTNHHRIVFEGELPKCNCRNCQFDRFEIESLLLHINDRNEFAENDLLELLITGFTQYKIGDFLNAYYSFEKLVKLSSDKEDFITAFLAYYNLQIVISLAIRETQKIEEKKRIAMQNRLKMNLSDKIQIPIDKDVENVLESIKDKELEKEITSKINTGLEKIAKNYRFHKKNSKNYSSGSVDGSWQTVWDSFILLKHHYRQNNLLDIELWNFRQLTRKVWTSLVTSYSIPRYEHRLRVFNGSMILEVIKILEPTEMDEPLKEFDIKTLKIDDLTSILDPLENFLNSSIRQSTFWGKSYHPRGIFEAQLNESWYFKSKCRKWLNNFLIVLSYLDISEEFSEQMEEILLKIVHYFSFYNHGTDAPGHDFLRLLLKRHFHFLREEDIQELIKYSLLNKNYNYDIIPQISTEIQKHFPDYKITEKHLSHSIVNYSLPNHQELNNLISIIPYQKFLDEDYQNILRQKVTTGLSSLNFRVDRF